MLICVMRFGHVTLLVCIFSKSRMLIAIATHTYQRRENSLATSHEVSQERFCAEMFGWRSSTAACGRTAPAGRRLRGIATEPNGEVKPKAINLASHGRPNITLWCRDTCPAPRHIDYRYRVGGAGHCDVERHASTQTFGSEVGLATGTYALWGARIPYGARCATRASCVFARIAFQ
jgi:hypothetical protein